MAELQEFTFYDDHGDEVVWSNPDKFPQTCPTEGDVRDMFQQQPNLFASYLNNQVVPAVNGKLEKGGGTMSAPINMGGNRITNVGTPTADADATTKAYVDGRYVTAGQKSGTTLGSRSTAEGYRATASGADSHAEGNGATASGGMSHAEGYETTAGGDMSHAEGWGASAEGYVAHAEGKSSSASGWYAHAEGQETTASGMIAHAEGNGTTASGKFAHAEGNGTVANHKSQHVFGEYNVADDSAAYGDYRGNYVEIVGNGTADNARANARTLDWSGNETLAGRLTLGSAPTANMHAATKKYVDDGLSAKQNTLTFDTTPTANSTKPVTSGGVYTALSGKQDTLTFDSAPTESSDNPVKSGGVYTALSGKQDTLTFDSAPTENSTRPVISGGVYTALNGLPDIYWCTYGETTYNEITAALTAGKLPMCLIAGETASVVYPYTNSYENMLDMATVYRFQTAYQVYGGQVTVSGLECHSDDTWNTFETILQSSLTFDSTPTASSNNPVKSSGVKFYADGKVVYLDTSEAASLAITALINALAGKSAVYAIVHDNTNYIDYTLPLVTQANASYGFAAFVGSSDAQSVTASLDFRNGAWSWTVTINPAA